MSRDDFSKETIRVLQERAGNHCSNPKCRCLTSGPNETLDKSSRIGVAAHITAAAPGGPRYSVSLTNDERRSSENGIWLCQNCARLIDVDPDTYTIKRLIEWRNGSEQWARDQIEGGRAVDAVGSPERWSCPYCGALAPHGRSVCLDCDSEVFHGRQSKEEKTGSPIPAIYGETYSVARALLIRDGWIPKIRHWSHGDTVNIRSGNGPHFWQKGYHELLYCSGTGYALCRFEFSDPKGNVLVIITAGEVLDNNDENVQVFRVMLNPKNEQGAYGDTLGSGKVTVEEFKSALNRVKNSSLKSE